MEKEKWESLLIGYIDGNVTEADVNYIEGELAKNEDLRIQYEQFREVLESMKFSHAIEPSAKFKNSFAKVLEREINTRKNNQYFFGQAFLHRAAAAVALLIVGGGIFFWINSHRVHQAELEAMRKEMESTKILLISMLKDQQSASQRLQGANVAFTMKKADDEIVTALVKAMNDDANTNVRLAALEALSKFCYQEHVRQALVASLSTQNDPVVQISLIRLMVEMKEKEAIQQLERITTDSEALPAVKDEAQTGLLRLS